MDIYYKDKIYEKEKLIEFLKNKDFKKNYKKIINDLDGCFSIVFMEKDKYYIISDMLRCFPVFYRLEKNIVYIYDNINDFKNKKINELSKKELFSCNYITGSDTIYEGIYQLEGHQIVIIDNKGINKKTYYEFNFNTNKKPSLKELDKIYDKCVKNAIKYANGKKILLPLSGGNDSRLLAYYLKKNNYSNILCYTYGNKYNNESDTSKRVAEYLGFPWVFINYDNKQMQKKYYNKKLYKYMANYCARGFSEPLIQEWEAIDYLKRNKIIDNECIVMPGYTNDVLCGSHILGKYLEKEKYTIDELICFIKEFHYIRNTLSNEELRIKICNTLNINYDVSTTYSKEELVELIEKFDFKERQVKFITNAIRVHDMNQLEWVLPFWTNELIDFWYSTDINERVNRNLFKKFTNHKYKKLMEYAPIYISNGRARNNNIFQKIEWILTNYWKGSLNLFGYFKYRDYLKYVLKYKISHYNCFFAADYIKYIERSSKNDKK